MRHWGGKARAKPLARDPPLATARLPGPNHCVPPEVFRGFGFPAADDIGNMFQFKRDFNDYFVGVRDIAFARTLNPELQSPDQWLGRHKDQIPIP